VIVANSVIGVVQELRAKRVLDQLSVVNAPRAHVVRDGQVREVQVHELVLDDVVELRAGAQVVADGTVLVDENLEIDESLLTGEADPVVKQQGDEVLSGSAVVAGTGRVRITKVGAENYAAKLAEEARRFTLVNSPLRNDVNRIVTWVGLPDHPGRPAARQQPVLRRDEGWQDAIISTVAGLVGMVPEGLVLLTSVAFAVGVVRLAGQRCLVQELPAIEVLARVDVLCADKTGTITEGSLALADVEARCGRPTSNAARSTTCSRRWPASTPTPTPPARALADHYPNDPHWSMTARTPFSSGRKWSSMTFDDHGRAWVLGAPENVLGDAVVGRSAPHRRTARRRGRAGPGAGSRRGRRRVPAADVRPIGLVLLEDVVRDDAPDTLRFFADQGVTVKVISGDNNVTVGAVARRAGLEQWELNVNAQTLPPDDDPEFADAIELGRVRPRDAAPEAGDGEGAAGTRPRGGDDRRRCQRRARAEGQRLRRRDGRPAARPPAASPSWC
jgi:cation-transporting ATPase E